MKIEKFIGIYENAFAPEFCQSVIDYFENAAAAGFAMTRQQSETGVPKYQKDSTDLYMHSEQCVSLLGTRIISKQFKDAFHNVLYPQYINEFDTLRTCGFLHTNYIKVQKTTVGGGYHIWHHETDTRETSNRVLAWMIYLNDVKEGGETEFLYQNLRIRPTTGTFVMWPAGFTHTHRGNPPLSGEKYIMTGWVEY
jgi:hypothetical protein